MNTRLLVLVILVTWLGQWMTADPAIITEAGATSRAIWYSGDDLVGLVIYHADRPALRSSSRRHHRRRARRHGKRHIQRRHASPVGKSEDDKKSNVSDSQTPPIDEEKDDERPRPETLSTSTSSGGNVLDSRRWGLSVTLADELPGRLSSFCEHYYECFRTRTRNAGRYAYHYSSGLLRMKTGRNYTNIGEETGVAGENIQHFVSSSPWSRHVLVEQIRKDIESIPQLGVGSVLILDESADESGENEAGAARQYNGRLGKVDVSQVGVFLGYANVTCPDRPFWAWVDGELYLPESWFTPEMAEERQRVGIPEGATFATKIERGWKMIQRVQAEGLPFEAVLFDDFYGRDTGLRDKVAGAGLIYLADIPCNTRVYLKKPVLGVPQPLPGRRGPKPTRLRVLNGIQPLTVRQVAQRDDIEWSHVRVRPIERGVLNDPFAVRRVWTLREGKSEPVEEWLVMRREAKNRCTYSLSNAPADSSIEYLAWLKCQRYFVERANQEAKSRVGWDELEARKFRAWEHHLALVILAVWFLARTRWEWAQRLLRDSGLASQFRVEVLPPLSLANIQDLLRAALPLRQPSPEETIALVARHLVNRARSRASRLKRQEMMPALNANAPP